MGGGKVWGALCQPGVAGVGIPRAASNSSSSTSLAGIRLERSRSLQGQVTSRPRVHLEGEQEAGASGAALLETRDLHQAAACTSHGQSRGDLTV